MTDCMTAIEQTGILPVINITEKETAAPLAKALMDGGIEVLEVTLRSECSLDAIEAIKKKYPEFFVGAGTVLGLKDAQDAISAGADFIVCPGLVTELIDFCNSKSIPVVPGCATPTEVQAAIKAGLNIVKFFPSEINGGINAINMLSGPFGNVKFIPTGGINFKNLESYVSSPKVIAAGGSFIATSQQLSDRDFAGITAACKKAITISLGFSLAHVGINHENEKQASDTANELAELFGADTDDRGVSIFAGTFAEAMKTSFYGTKGHIGFYTNSVYRALAYFEKKSIPVIKDSIKYDAKGCPTIAYLKDEIGGFAVHVVRR